MQKELVFHDKKMKINLSNAAFNESKNLKNPLVIEVQIYFSCLLAKRLAFHTEQPLIGACTVSSSLFASIINKSKQLENNLFVRFNTIMTQTCPASGEASAPPVTDFEVADQKPYVPSWLNIDFKDGMWSGEYGWKSSVVGYANTKQIREVVEPG